METTTPEYEGRKTERKVLTGEQVRAAIAGLRWSQMVLSNLSGIPPRTIQRVADTDGTPSTNARTLATLRRTFEENGAVFMEQDGVSGVMVPPSPRTRRTRRKTLSNAEAPAQ